MNALDLTTPLGMIWALLPEIVLVATALVTLLVTGWRHQSAADSRLVGWLSLGGVVLSAAALAWLWHQGAHSTGLAQMMALDGFRFASAGVVLLTSGVTIALSLGYLPRSGILAPEYYPLVLLGTAGMLVLAGAADLLVLFLGLEVMSLAVYVLTGFDRRSTFSAEAGLKYFLIGAFASGFLLYGIALVYGATGTTNLVLAGAQLSQGTMSLMAQIGLAMLLIGLGFKISAVPFHMWAPDAYDGAPTPVTGLMATGVKAAAFLALVRLVLVTFPEAADLWQPVIGVLALATMVVGNLVALAQRSIKRMLAYSSIAHAGYLLVGLWPGTAMGAGSVLLYLLAYSLTTLAAFGLLGTIGRDAERHITLDDLAGWGQTHPWAAMGFTICLLSLLGFPGTFGFIGKWLILSAVVVEGQWILPIALVLTSVVSAGYYLPVIMAMYMRAPEEDQVELALPGATVGVLTGTILALLIFGVWPTGLLDAAIQSAGTLLQQAFPLAGR